MKTPLLGKLPIAAALACFGFMTQAQIYEYVLQPGSTITPMSGGAPSGPGQALSGTFSWNYVGDFVFQGQDDYQFVVTALSFSSASYSLTIDSNPANSATGGGAFAWDPMVYTTGLAQSPGRFLGPEGTYTGNGQNPSQLSISDYIYPASGPALAAVTFTAVPVPEPDGLVVLGAGLMVVLGGIFKTRVQGNWPMISSLTHSMRPGENTAADKSRPTQQ